MSDKKNKSLGEATDEALRETLKHADSTQDWSIYHTPAFKQYDGNSLTEISQKILVKPALALS
jgi:hypothetical protein